MRFWITRNSEQPIREQLVRQIMLAILSEDLPAHQKLPSIRALARRHKIHSNTVSGAYHDLLGRGWVELRRGSGLYVKPLPTSGPEGSTELDALIANLLRDARKLGHEPDEVLDRLDHIVRPRHYKRVIIAEPEPGMREILRAEIEAKLPGRVDSADPAQLPNLDDAVVAALPSRTAAVRARLPRHTPCVTLKINSVQKSLLSYPKPPAHAIHTIVSGSLEFRSSSRTMLIAVGLHPDSICDLDTAVDGWQSRIDFRSILVADVVSARVVESPNVFRVVSEASLSELEHLLDVTPPKLPQPHARSL